MNTYISILRGINVSGQKLIKMETLRKAYEELGFREVVSYVQSGNLIFKSESTDPKALEEKIAQQIEAVFGFDVPVIVLTASMLAQIIERNPFAADPGKDSAFLHVTFLAAEPSSYDQKAIEAKKQDGEEISFSDKAVYLYCPNGYGRTKLTNNFLEAKLKVGATTRNWKTTNKLLSMSSAHE